MKYKKNNLNFLKSYFLIPKKNSGFTLIELLVVVSIISLLSSIIMTSLVKARSKARDAVRISNLQTLSKALELYYSNHNKYPDNPYPSDGGGQGCPGMWHSGNVLNGSANQFLQVLVDEKIMQKTPLESYWNTDRVAFASTPWFSTCTYRYAKVDFSSTQSSTTPPVTCISQGYRTAAVLYTVLENLPPDPKSGRQPSCLDGTWGEGYPGQWDYLILLKESGN
jgi:prepilin-type N-terminal cleavage/methylation domain-containing protein